MTESPRQATAAPGHTDWSGRLKTPLRQFLRTQTGSAAVLLAATLAALVWANVAPGRYQQLWDTPLSVHLGRLTVSHDLHVWVNSGLMTFFFFVVGLEARREFDLGELRERRRLAMPLLAGLGGMIVPVAIFLAANAGGPAAHGWGTAMSTDTAFALGVLALVGRKAPDRLRSFLLTFAVVDDLSALAIIAIFYSHQISMPALLAGLGVFAVVLAVRAAGVRRGLVYLVLGVAAWGAFMRSGVDPVVVGLVMGLLTQAYPAARSDLERASEQFRLFREQPGPAPAAGRLGRAAGRGHHRRYRFHRVAADRVAGLHRPAAG